MSITNCDHPTFNPRSSSATEPQAKPGDCQSITNYMDTDPNGHGQWKIKGSAGLDPLASSGTCFVGVTQQSGSKEKTIEFGNKDLKNIIEVKQGKETLTGGSYTGSIRCGNAIMDFKVYGKQK
ncbi:hypothetical protein PG984_012537 [Apiospora sp. TS-2023a]